MVYVRGFTLFIMTCNNYIFQSYVHCVKDIIHFKMTDETQMFDSLDIESVGAYANSISTHTVSVTQLYKGEDRNRTYQI